MPCCSASIDVAWRDCGQISSFSTSVWQNWSQPTLSSPTAIACWYPCRASGPPLPLPSSHCCPNSVELVVNKSPRSSASLHTTLTAASSRGTAVSMVVACQSETFSTWLRSAQADTTRTSKPSPNGLPSLTRSPRSSSSPS